MADGFQFDLNRKRTRLTDGDLVELEVDHIIPVAKRGGNERDNLQTLCRSCNQGKKDK